MAHFAQVDENGIVIQVIVAEQEFIDFLVASEPPPVEEEEPVEEDVDAEVIPKEPRYTKQWIQTSYNTKHGVHINGGTPLRANYATIGCIYDRDNDVFYPPKPIDLPTAVISGAPTWEWTFPIPKPTDGLKYTWDEAKGTWVERLPLHLIITPDDDGYDSNSPTFLVYDVESNQFVHTCPRLPELNAEEVAGQGRPTFRPFGITTDDKFLYVVSHNRLGKFDKKTYQFLELIDVPLFINTHEMVIHNNVLYTANTSNDTIGIYDLAKKNNKFFNVSTLKVTQDAPTPDNVESLDGAHVNSLCYHEGKIYFCLHHLDRRDSQFGYFDTKTFKAEVIADAGRCAHGVQVIYGTLYSLSTGTGEVIEVDLATKDVALHKVVDPAKTFLRGLDILEGSIIFGGSNTYSEERTIYMDNCFVAYFDSVNKKSGILTIVNNANIISDMKVLK